MSFLLINPYPMNTYGGSELTAPRCLNPALGGRECSVLRPDCFTPCEDPTFLVTVGGWVDPKAFLHDFGGNYTD
jgi:hypothetical protein